MASTRKSARPSSKNTVHLSGPKKPKLENELALEQSPSSNLDIEVDDESENVIVDYTGGNIVEEIVVTVDDSGVPEVQTETEIDSSMLEAPVATITVPGGVLPSEPAESGMPEKLTYVFKDPNFIHSSKGPGGNKKTRIWKNLKQIVAAERSLAWKPTDVTYGSIDAPPSFKPAKKYSDISGLEAKYTDPQTKMRFANTDEYRRVRMLPGDIISGCLQLRKAKTLVP